MPAPSVIVASNRGPLSHRVVDGSVIAGRGGGGLVSALSTLAGDDDALWICAALSDADRQAVAAATPAGRMEANGLAVLMLDIDPRTTAAAYDGIANSTLWFLHHQLFDLPVEPVFDRAFDDRWNSFVAFNAAFAAAIAAEAAEGATVLVQDYHLCLVPAQLRSLRPDLSIGHFSHTPWAPAATFRLLPRPVATEILEGILGADRAGFLSPRWATDFAVCCLDILGASYDGQAVTHSDRRTELAVHALGVDAGALAENAGSPAVAEHLASLGLPGQAVIGRVDRTELSKNIVRGLLAFAELLREFPRFSGRVTHVATAYPSRLGLAAYRNYMQSVEDTAAAINAEFGTPTWTPVILLREDDYPLSLAVLRRSDVLLVNPIRDGMNLVAKEGPLLTEHDAPLVLSTEAGAADELSAAALMVNPYDVSATAQALAEALDMAPGEKVRRAAELRAAATKLPPQQWFAEQREALRR